MDYGKQKAKLWADYEAKMADAKAIHAKIDTLEYLIAHGGELKADVVTKKEAEIA